MQFIPENTPEIVFFVFLLHVKGVIFDPKNVFFLENNLSLKLFMYFQTCMLKFKDR